jgi:peptidyl-prolyl cis-trans isomerase C
MLKCLLGATALALLALPALAQDPLPVAPPPPAETVPAPPAPDAVLAKVDGTTITGADLATAYKAIGEAVERVPPQQRDEMLVGLLVDMQLMANAAEKAGLGATSDFQQRVAFMRKQALQEAYMNDLIAREVTPAAVNARYQAEVGKLPKEEMSTSHILVEDEATAKDLIAQLNNGADFAKLASENSKDPGSAAQGGSLGFTPPGQLVPEYEQAALALEIGKVTAAPVQSQFGWHVIRLDDKRPTEPPPLDSVKEQIEQVLMREAYFSAIEGLKNAASIERPGAPADAPAAPAAPPAAPAPQ